MTAPTKVQDDLKKLSSPKPTRPVPPTPIENALAKRGLARGGQDTEAETPESESDEGTKHEYVTDDSGMVTGTKDTTKHSKSAGLQGEVSSEHASFDGRTNKKTSGEAKGLLGVEASVEIVSKASKEELKYSMEALARAGAFGEAKGGASVKRGKGSASVNGEASGGMGAQAELKMAASIDRSGLLPALEAVIEAGIKAGVWGEGKFDAQAAYGKLAIKVCGDINGFAGAQAKFDAKVFANAKDGVGGEFNASALLGASSEGNLSAELSLGPAAFIVKGGYEAKAGLAVDASGKLKVSLKGVEAKFEANALAGASVTAKASGGIKLMGKKIIWAKGEVEASVGVGGTVKGEFVLANGKIKIGGKLAATLGIGGGVDAELEIDFGQLADVIIAKVGEMSAGEDNKAIRAESPDFERKPLPPLEGKKKEKVGYDAVYEDFVAYATKKSLDAGAKNGIKKDRVEAIIQNAAPLLRNDFAYIETDTGIEKAAMDAFAGMIKHIQVQAGYIRSFQAESADKVTEHKKVSQRDAAWMGAHDKLNKDLTEYCTKTTGKGGTNGIKQGNVQGILDKHYPTLVKSFGDGQADEIVRLATKPVEQLLDGFLATGGKINMFVESAGKAKDANAKVVKTAADATLNTAVNGFAADLTKLRGQLIAKLGATLKQEDLQKLVTSAAGKAKGADGGDVDAALAKQVLETFDGVVEGIVIKDAKIDSAALVIKHNGLITKRAEKATGERDAAQEEAVNTFKESLRGYLEGKTAKGKNGVKQVEVQKRFDTATKNTASWALTADASTRMQTAAQEALAGVLKEITIKAGKVDVKIDDAAMSKLKSDRKENGRARLGGDEDDGLRRKMVADAVRAEFKAYAAEVRSAAEAGKAKGNKVERGRLQGIIDKSLKNMRADVLNEVGDSALSESMTTHFGALIKTVSVQKLQLTSLEPETSMAAITKAKREASGATLQAQRDMSAEIKGLKVPVADRVQKVIDKYKPKFSAMPADEADTAMTMAIFNAIGAGAIQAVEVVGGKLTKFELRKLVETGRH